MSPSQVAPAADSPKATRTPRLQVYLNHIDHTLIPPGPLDNSSLYCVPVLRIFGLSSAGQKTCVHVHQVYPYFYVAYPGKLSPSHGLCLFLLSVCVPNPRFSKTLHFALNTIFEPRHRTLSES